MVFVMIISILHRKIEAFTEFKHQLEDLPSHVGPRVSSARFLCLKLALDDSLKMIQNSW